MVRSVGRGGGALREGALRCGAGLPARLGSHPRLLAPLCLRGSLLFLSPSFSIFLSLSLVWSNLRGGLLEWRSASRSNLALGRIEPRLCRAVRKLKGIRRWRAFRVWVGKYRLIVEEEKREQRRSTNSSIRNDCRYSNFQCYDILLFAFREGNLFTNMLKYNIH